MFEAMLDTRRLWPSRARAKKPGAPSAPAHQYRSRMSAAKRLGLGVQGGRLAHPRRAGAAPRPARGARGRRSPGPPPSRSVPRARRPSGNWTAFSESFQLWLAERPGPPRAGTPAGRRRRGRRALASTSSAARAAGSSSSMAGARTPPSGRAVAVEDEEERRRVDRPEVGAGARGGAVTEPLAGGSGAPRAGSCPGCSSLPGSSHAPLASGEGRERVEHLVGMEGASLVAGDQAVAAEEGDEPGDARGHQAPAGDPGRRAGPGRRGRRASAGTPGPGPGGRCAPRRRRGRPRGDRAPLRRPGRPRLRSPPCTATREAPRLAPAQVRRPPRDAGRPETRVRASKRNDGGQRRSRRRRTESRRTWARERTWVAIVAGPVSQSADLEDVEEVGVHLHEHGHRGTATRPTSAGPARPPALPPRPAAAGRPPGGRLDSPRPGTTSRESAPSGREQRGSERADGGALDAHAPGGTDGGCRRR